MADPFLIAPGPQIGCTCSQKQMNGMIIQAAISNPTSSCGCWNEPSLNGTGLQNCSCCVNNQTLAIIPQPMCPASSVMSYSECADIYNNFTRGFSKVCNISSRPSSIQVIYQDNVSVVNASQNCACINITIGSRVFQQCQCCVQNSTFLPIRNQAQCDNITTNQSCDCRPMTDLLGMPALSCNCTTKVNSASISVPNVQLTPSTCSCVNTTIGSRNYLNCSCCAPQPPASQCQQLSTVNATNLNCRQCVNATQTGRIAQIKCGTCNALVNSTDYLFRQGLILNSSQCCCVSQIDPFTKKSFLTCNCSQTAVPVMQQCSCNNLTNNVTGININCSCTDCNRRVSTSFITRDRCSCAATTSTNLSAPRNCSCSVDFNGICASVVPNLASFDENTCDASNRPKILNITQSNGTQCGTQYEYLVAVVAAGKDSSVLLNLQSYQLMAANYLKSASIAIAFFATLAIALVY